MKLYRPVAGQRYKDWRLTQKYGNNFKVGGKRFYGEIIKARNKHEGIDYAGPNPGDIIPCYSAFTGVVSFAGRKKGFGKCVYIGNGAHETVHAHLSSIDVKEGEQVNAMQHIGYIGNTGTSTGVHLHFGLRPLGGWRIDPTPYISEREATTKQELIELNSKMWQETDDEHLKDILHMTNNYLRSN